MNWRLFFTLVAAALVSWLLIEWLRNRRAVRLERKLQAREIGFHTASLPDVSTAPAATA